MFDEPSQDLFPCNRVINRDGLGQVGHKGIEPGLRYPGIKCGSCNVSHLKKEQII